MLEAKTLSDGAKPSAKRKDQQSVLLAYDHRCRLHADGKIVGEFLGRAHPERPERATAIMARLQAAGLVKRCLRTMGRQATPEELLAVHDKGLVAAVDKATARAAKAEQLAENSWYGPEAAALDALQLDGDYIQDVYFNGYTAACARLAAGSAAEVARRVVTGAARHGAAIIRPPGHHAESGTAMGFCYYNNAAVAARAAQAAGARRVVIMDWDVHHGNGTQRIFYEDPSVLYMSTHRYDNGCFYPGSGDATETGSGPGQGFTVNVPWNGPGVRDSDMLAAFRHVIIPLASEFRPDLVIISAGFDAVEGDPLGGCRLSPAAYSHFTAALAAIAPTVLLLEGGYNLTATAAATEACLRVLLGDGTAPLADDVPKAATEAVPAPGCGSDPWVAAGLDGVSDAAQASLLQVLQVQREFWEPAKQHAALVAEAVKARRKGEEQERRKQEPQRSQQEGREEEPPPWQQELAAVQAAILARQKRQEQQEQERRDQEQRGQEEQQRQDGQTQEQQRGRANVGGGEVQAATVGTERSWS